MSRWRARSLPLAALLGLACVDEPEPPPISWTGEHVRVGADRPEAICGGSRAELDRLAGELWTRLGASPKPIAFYWLDDLDEFCPSGATGCFLVDERELFSLSIPHRHELVHARGPLMAPLLEEGLAGYLDGAYPIAALGSRDAIAQMLAQPSREPSTPQDYSRARHFVGFLIETFGWDAMIELDARVGRKPSAAELDAAFTAATGYGSDALLGLYADYPDCYGWSEAPLCDALEPVPLAALETLTRTIDCSNETTLGPALGSLAYAEVLVEIPPATGIDRQFQFTAPAGVDVFGYLRSCGGCSEATFSFQSAVYTASAAELPAGTYVLRFYAPVDAGPVEVGFTFGP